MASSADDYNDTDNQTLIFEDGGREFPGMGFASKLEVFQRNEGRSHQQFCFVVKDYDGNPAALRYLEPAAARSLAYELLDRTSSIVGDDDEHDSQNDPIFIVFGFTG